ncbi:hypothetical protein COLO4_02229, partial [Corchorus olitorius]
MNTRTCRLLFSFLDTFANLGVDQSTGVALLRESARYAKTKDHSGKLTSAGQLTRTDCSLRAHGPCPDFTEGRRHWWTAESAFTPFS